MGQKYSIIYNDTVNVEHEVQIYDDSYSDTVIDVLGRAYLDCSSTDDPLESIRGQGLRLELEADADRTFSDLYAEEEQTFRVVYLRDSTQLFEGWLNPEGFYEDMVSSEWVVSFDCVDGLSYLKNLSFVETDGTLITGRITQLSALVKAFARTGLQKDIYTAINIFYTGLSTSVNVLANVYVIADRFIKDDGNTIMSCEEVIRSILEPYAAVCKSYGEGWYIYRPNELYASHLVTFWEYDYTGSAGAGFGLDLSATLGSHINRFYPHHINENQQLGIKPSLGAYRIHYKYGDIQGFFDNTKLVSDDGNTIEDWTIPEVDSGTTDSTTANKLADSTQNFSSTVAVGDQVHNTTDDTYAYVTTVDSNVLLTLDADIMVSGETYSIKGARHLDTPFPIGTGTVQIDCVALGNEIEDLRTTASTISDTSETNITINFTDAYAVFRQFEYQVYISDKTLPDVTANVYYLKSDGTWGAVGVSYTLFTARADYGSGVVIDVVAPSKPGAISGDGYLYVGIWTPIRAAGGEIVLTEVTVISADNADDASLGEIHTFQRSTKPSAQIKEVKEVYTGDSEEDIYLGTLYENDSTTATSSWTRLGLAEAKKILRIMGEETMRLSQSPSRVYSGDIYGYVNYLDRFTIDGVDGYFVVLEYSYDTKENITSVVMRQIFGDTIGDLLYEEKPDNGNVVTPTIIS